ncbi:MAG TPA: ion transporter [Gammaproteobacteria bacterium]|nr:ion transporter [Gammaproteobacteria bacterium]
MSIRSFQILLGLSGVAEDERPRARRWGDWFEWPMILLAVWILVEWYVEAKGLYPKKYAVISDWVILTFFIAETFTLTLLVRDKWRYLRTNWLNLFIIITGLPVLWGAETYSAILRSLRLLLILPLLTKFSDVARRVLAHNQLGTTLLVTFVFTVMAGLLIAGIDPSIHSVWDGIWWAWVTVATVGYGDIVPHSPAGKIFGAILILFGVGFFSLLTANFSAYFVARGEKQIHEEEAEEIRRLALLEVRLKAMEETLEKIAKRLEADEEKEEDASAGEPQDRS